MSLVEQYIREYREQLNNRTKVSVSQLAVAWADGNIESQITITEPHYLAVWESVMWIPSTDSPTLNQVDIYDTYPGTPLYQLYRQLGAGLPNNYHYAVSYTELILPATTLTFVRIDPTGDASLYIPAFKLMPY